MTSDGWKFEVCGLKFMVGYKLQVTSCRVQGTRTVCKDMLP